MERLIRKVGEEPDPKASVVLWWRLSLDERYQRYELVERGLYELAAAHPELGDEPSEGASESSHR